MKIIKYIGFLCVAYIFTGCAKTEEFNNTETKVGQSRVTFFPVLTIKGEEYMAIEKGTTFTDPGVTAKEGSKDLPVNTGGQAVNKDVPGVYVRTYSATNQDGFSVATKRYVIVYSTDASAAANNLSGTYLRAATGVTSTWTKIAPGVYKVQNPGGAGAGVGLYVVAFNATGFKIEIPPQTGSDTYTSDSSDEVYTNSTPPTYTWRYLNPGANYGTGLRVFVKQ